MPPPTPVTSAKKAAVTKVWVRRVAASAPVVAKDGDAEQIEPGQDRAELPEERSYTPPRCTDHRAFTQSGV